MNRLDHTKQAKKMRTLRVRSRLASADNRPRLSINISERNIIAQVIDDQSHKTLAYSTTVGSKKAAGTLTEKAAWVGADIANKAIAKKVKKVVFDRGSKLYHGRVRALAEAARAAGLEF